MSKKNNAIQRTVSNSLLSMCIKQVGRNMKLYENDDDFIRLPKHLKVRVVRFITRCLQSIHPTSFQILLNDRIFGLNLVSFDVSDELLQTIAMKCPNLRCLYFRGNVQDLSIEGIRQIPKLRHLEQLEILDCPLIDDEFIESISISCTNLFHLSIPGSKISDDSLEHLKKIKLRNLNISKTIVSDEFIEKLSHSDLGNSLEELSISNNSNITNKGLSHLPWKKLKYVSFHGCNTDETLFDTIRPTSKFLVWSVPY